MNKTVIPAFFLLGSLILGISIMIPQFTYAQGEQKVNEQQIQALKLFFNEQNMQDTNNNQQSETSDSQSSEVTSQNLEQQQQQPNNDNQQDMMQFSNIQSQPSSSSINNNQQLVHIRLSFKYRKGTAKITTSKGTTISTSTTTS